MVDWTFSDVLATIKSLPSIPTSVLESPDGLHLGYIHFAEIHTTLWMCVVSTTLLEKLVADGCFNLECKAHGDYSHSTALLLAFIPNTQQKDIERLGIRLIVRWVKVLLAPISTMGKLFSYVHDTLKFERASSTPQVRTYCMIFGNYGGHMAYATDSPFCVAYPLEFIDKKDPGTMIFWNPDNHPVTFIGGQDDHMLAAHMGLFGMWV